MIRRRQGATSAWLGVAATAVASACGHADPQERPAPHPVAAPLLEATLPPARDKAGDERFLPSLVRMAGAELDKGTFGAKLTDAETCAGCHADVAATWRTSAHALASFNNPVYRGSVDRFRREKGAKTSRWCGGCHDVALTADGAMDQPVEAGEMRAHGGVTCRTCHGIARVRPDGDGSYELDANDIPVPREGDDASLALHKARAAQDPLRTAALCSTCHRVFLDEASGNAHHLPGQDDATPWARSLYGGSLGERVDEELPTQDCRGCHMPRELATQGDAAATAAKGGRVASHRFLGAHTWLASMRGDADSLDRARAFLQGAVTLDVAAVTTSRPAQAPIRTFPADGVEVLAGDAVTVDVVAFNQRVGHRFPGGVLDAADAWIELTVDDARGKAVAGAGLDHRTSARDDETAHVLRATIVDDHGRPVIARETDRFRAVVSNHTIPPRDAEVTRFAFVVPRDAVMPLRVRARLLHRTRSLAVQALACAESRTERGRAFRDAGKKRNGEALDPCPPEPITVMSDSVVWLGAGGADRTAAHPHLAWRRLTNYGMGLSRALQENVTEARGPLEAALPLAPGERERAVVLAALAQVAAREGRPDEAISLADRAEAGAPGHPALARIRGDALAAVWRFSEATPHLQRCADASPSDDSAFARLAMALGSAGQQQRALDVARRGLLLQPRDPDMLRTQAIALHALGADASLAREAEEAYLRHRPDDRSPGFRGACSMKVPGCALERDPVHVHPTR